MKTSILSLSVLLVLVAAPLRGQMESEATKVEDETSVEQIKKETERSQAPKAVRKVTRISNTVTFDRNVRPQMKGKVAEPSAGKETLATPVPKVTSQPKKAVNVKNATGVEKKLPDGQRSKKVEEEKGKEQ